MTMKMIQPNCRVQFAAEDIDFIVSVLGSRLGNAECLIQLLADEESRDLVLDDEALLRALLERRGCLRVSTHFYFYVPTSKTARWRITSRNCWRSSRALNGRAVSCPASQIRWITSLRCSRHFRPRMTARAFTSACTLGIIHCSSRECFRSGFGFGRKSADFLI